MAPVHEERYDYCDGEPMTDSDINRLLMEYVELTLKARYENDPKVYVSANVFVDFLDQDGQSDRVSPDVFVVVGVENRLRTTYDMVTEKLPPLVAFEFASRRTKQRDAGAKKLACQQMGVQEYYVFDASGVLIEPRFQAFHLVDAVYGLQSSSERVSSPALGLDLVVDGNVLWLEDTVSQHRYPMADKLHRLLQDAETGRQEAEARAADAEARAEAAEERLRALEDEVRRLRGK